MNEQAEQRSDSVWSNRFGSPDLETLLDDVPTGESEPGEPDKPGEALRAVFDGLRERKGCRIRVEWLGLPWRWTIVVAHPDAEHPDLAYLVPSPENPMLCVPVATTGPNKPDFAALTKPVRQTLDASAIVAGYIWAEWPISAVDLVAIKPLLDARAGTGAGDGPRN